MTSSEDKLQSILLSLREYAKPIIRKKELLQLIMKAVNTMNPYPWLNLLEAYGIVKKDLSPFTPHQFKTYVILLDSVESEQISVKPHSQVRKV